MELSKNIKCILPRDCTLRLFIVNDPVKPKTKLCIRLINRRTIGGEHKFPNIELLNIDLYSTFTKQTSHLIVRYLGMVIV